MVIGEILGSDPAGGEGAGTARHVYRSSRALSRWLVGALLLGLALNLALSGIDALVTLRHPSLFDPDAEITGPGELAVVLGFMLVGLAGGLVLASCVVLFCVWVHRANRNAHALGARGMEFTPGWAVGWFFVPVANLFKPYQAVREIHQASDPDLDRSDEGATLAWRWSERPAPVQLKLWWGTWLVMNVVENAGLRLTFREDAASRATSSWLGVAGAVAAIPCTLLLIWVIFEIQDRQARRHAGGGVLPPGPGSVSESRSGDPVRQEPPAW